MKKLFVTGMPVTGDDFTGRTKEIAQVKYFLENGQSVVLIGPRRFGKTSLILTVLQNLKGQGFYTADVDLFTIIDKNRLAATIVEKTLENRRVSSVITRIKKEISQALKNVQVKQIIEDYEVVLKFVEPNADEDDLLDSALDFPQKFAIKEEKDLYFFYDEFGDIIKFDGDKLIKLMRGKFQRHSNVCYIFAGSQESLMKELFSKEKSAFYKFARIIYLEEIDVPDFAQFIKKRFNLEGIGISEDSIIDILNRTRGHPYYTQLLCSFIHYHVARRKVMVAVSDIKEAYENALISERTFFEKIWEELTPTQLKILFRIMFSDNLYSNEKKINIARSIQSLLLKGIIKKTGRGKYTLIDPFFEEFLRRNQ